jgi:hypothetical protein|tara:strand:- start:297 stop:584 length:288 start_codon:yes stop_codon:yes gene_type:complete
MIEYIIYGIVDNFIMILGSISGYSFEKYLPKRLQTGFGAVYGAGLGNALSDFLGGMSTWSVDLAMGTSFGCLLALVFIPIFIYIGKLRVRKNENI